MSIADWFSQPTNWVYLVLALIIVISAVRVVTSTNVVHAALFLRPGGLAKIRLEAHSGL